jgi:hypothetical protein
LEALNWGQPAYFSEKLKESERLFEPLTDDEAVPRERGWVARCDGAYCVKHVEGVGRRRLGTGILDAFGTRWDTRRDALTVGIGTSSELDPRRGGVVTEWFERPYERGEMIDLPGLPRPMFPPDAAEHGQTPSPNGPDVIGYKRTVARLGRWKWDPHGWDDSYSNAFAHGKSGGKVGESGIAGVQRQAGITPDGFVGKETFNLLRSVKIPKGLPHAGEHAMDTVARDLFVRASKDRQPSPASSLKDVHAMLSSGAPHWGGSNDVMQQYVEPFMVKRGLPLGSGKRTPAENQAAGGSPTSDHLTTHETTAARDFPTFTGEDHARALAASIGFVSWQPNSFEKFTFSAGGRNWRAQILWGAGIGHGDHVHVGISPA